MLVIYICHTCSVYLVWYVDFCREHTHITSTQIKNYPNPRSYLFSPIHYTLLILKTAAVLISDL
jgi:hypothetical protein